MYMGWRKSYGLYKWIMEVERIFDPLLCSTMTSTIHRSIWIVGWWLKLILQFISKGVLDFFNPLSLWPYKYLYNCFLPFRITHSLPFSRNPKIPKKSFFWKFLLKLWRKILRSQASWYLPLVILTTLITQDMKSFINGFFHPLSPKISPIFFHKFHPILHGFNCLWFNSLHLILLRFILSKFYVFNEFHLCSCIMPIDEYELCFGIMHESWNWGIYEERMF